MATGTYNRGKARVLAGTTLLGSSPLKAMLVGAGFVFDPTHNVVADVVADEVAGTGYTGGFGGAGRKAVASPVITENDVDNRAEFSCATFLWTSIDVGEVAGIVLLHEITSDALSPIISFHATAGGNVETNGANLSLTIPLTGLLRLVDP